MSDKHTNEIKPITVHIRLTDYLEVNNIETIDINHSDIVYSKLKVPIKVLMYDGDGVKQVILIGYYKLSKGLSCIVRELNVNDDTPIIISIHKLRICKEVVLKEQLKDIKTVEQLKIF